MARPVLDVSKLPTIVFGPRTTLWLGFAGVIVVEGMMILLIIVGYFYLAGSAATWSFGPAPPSIGPGIVNTAVYLLSAIPAMWLKRAAERADLRRVRTLLLVMSAIIVVTMTISGWAFATLNTRGDGNAYGSLVWMLLGTHVVVLIAAALVIWTLALFMFRGKVDGRRYMNAYQSADYWLLAIYLWLLAALVIYVAPRAL